MVEEAVPTRGALTADQLHGFAALANACVAVLVNEPGVEVLDSLRSVAAALGDDRFDGIESSEGLRQRYYDRFFVPSSPSYVPLCESSVRESYEDAGRTVYAPLAGPRVDHVLACYRAVGFDYRSLGGFAPATKTLKPDSFACELAFMASLARAAAGTEDADAGERAAQLLARFASEHPGRWFGKAAACLERVSDDVYARVCALAAEAVASIEAA